MLHIAPHSAEVSPAVGGRHARMLRALLPAIALGGLVWLAPAESDAAPRCNSKPAVCARLAMQAKASAARAPAPAPVVVASADTATRCTSKPMVCARRDNPTVQRGPAAPVIAQGPNTRTSCTTKPAVCARLKLTPSSPPVTLANTPGVTVAD